MAKDDDDAGLLQMKRALQREYERLQRMEGKTAPSSKERALLKKRKERVGRELKRVEGALLTLGKAA